MSTEISKQILARLQDEMSRNISSIKQKISEWLDHPQAGGLEFLRDSMGEISGGLSMLNRPEAAELSNEIMAVIVALQKAVSDAGDTKPADFDSAGAEVASAILILDDYIDRLDEKQRDDGEIIREIIRVLQSLKEDTTSRSSFSAPPKITKDTYQALAAKVSEVIETSRNQIEQYAHDPEKPFNASALISHNKNLINMFAVLDLKEPQLLLQKINQMLVEQLSESQWIDVAEAMILVEETLNQVQSNRSPVVSTYAEAVAEQTRHSRELEVNNLVRDTGEVAFRFFEAMRKKVVHDEKIHAVQGWRDAALRLAHYSAIAELVELLPLAEVLKNMGKSYAAISLQPSVDANVFASVIDSLVGAEYIFFELSESGHPSKQDIVFLRESVENIGRYIPVTPEAERLFAGFIDTDIESEHEEREDLSGAFSNILSGSLDTLDRFGAPVDMQATADGIFDEMAEETLSPSMVHVASVGEVTPGKSISSLDDVTIQGNIVQEKAVRDALPSLASASEQETMEEKEDATPSGTNLTAQTESEGGISALPQSGELSAFDVAEPAVEQGAQVSGEEQAVTAFVPFFRGKSMTDLDVLPIPDSKKDFVNAHADAVMDDEIREFFVEELAELIELVNKAYPQWLESPESQMLTTELRRAFHTLKGSGRTVGYESLGEFAWQHEQLLNRVLDNHYRANKLVQSTVGDAIDLLNILKNQDEFFEHQGALLQQAAVAEAVREALMQDREMGESQGSFVQISRQLRLHEEQLAGRFMLANEKSTFLSEKDVVQTVGDSVISHVAPDEPVMVSYATDAIPGEFALSDETYEQGENWPDESASVDVRDNEQQDLETVSQAFPESPGEVEIVPETSDAVLFDLVGKDAEETVESALQKESDHEDDWIPPFSLADDTEEISEEFPQQAEAVPAAENVLPFELLPHGAESATTSVESPDMGEEEALVADGLFSLVGEDELFEHSAPHEKVESVAVAGASKEDFLEFLDEALPAESPAESLPQSSRVTDEYSGAPVTVIVPELTSSNDTVPGPDARMTAKIVKTLQRGLGDIPEAERTDAAISAAMEETIKRQLAQEQFDDPARLAELAKAVREEISMADATLARQAEDILSRVAESAKANDESVEIDFTDMDFLQELAPIDPRAEQVVRMLEQGLAERADDARLSAALLKHQLSNEVLSNSSKLDALLAEINAILNGMSVTTDDYETSDDFAASVEQISQIIEEGLALGSLSADDKEALAAAVRQQLTYPPASLQDSDALKEAVGARLEQNDILSSEDVQDVLQGAFIRVAHDTEAGAGDLSVQDAAARLPLSPVDALQALDDAAVSTLRKTLQKALGSGHVDESVAAGIGMALAHQWQQNNLPLDDAAFAAIAARLRHDCGQDSDDVEVVLQALAKRLGVTPAGKIDDSPLVSFERKEDDSSLQAGDWLDEVVANDADDQMASRGETLLWDSTTDIEHTASAAENLADEALFALDVGGTEDVASDALSDSFALAEAPDEEAVVEAGQEAGSSVEPDNVPLTSPMTHEALVSDMPDDIDLQTEEMFVAQAAEKAGEAEFSFDEEKTASELFSEPVRVSSVADTAFTEDTINLPFDASALPACEETGEHLPVSGLSEDMLHPVFSETAADDESVSDSIPEESGSEWVDMAENMSQPAVSMRPSAAAQRLSRELEELSQHPALNDAVNRSSSVAASNARSGPAVFLHAVDRFETLSQQVENSNDPDAINELIESVYDIEDSIEPETAPDWIWRMLDAVEQLLLMYKYQGAAVSLSAASILRQSAHLIEHHKDQENEDEALETINSLISARQERSKISSAQQDAPLAGSTPGFASANYSEELVQDPNANSVLSETFLDEAMALFGRGQLDAEQWDEDLSRVNILDRMRRDMHTLKGSARMAGYMAIGDLTHAVESLIDNILDGYSEASPRAAAILSGAMWQGMIMLDNIRDGYLPQIDPYILNNISDYLKQPLPYPEVAEREKEAKELQRQEAEDAQFRALEEATRPVQAEAPAAAVPEVEGVFGEGFDSDIDPVLVDIFSDEAEELLQATETHLESDIANPGVAEEFKRTMHTLKGGARLVGLTAMGDTSHLMESVMEKVPELGEGKIRQAKTLLQAGYESLRTMLDAVLRQEMPKPADAVNHALELFVREGRFETPKVDTPVQTPATSAADTALAPETVSVAEQSPADEAVAGEPVVAAVPGGEAEASIAAGDKAEPAVQSGKSAATAQEAAVQESVTATEAQSAPAPSASMEKAAETMGSPASQPDDTVQDKPESTAAEKEKSAQDQDRMSDVSRFVRVDSQLLDEIIAMVGEASIMRSRIENLSAGVEFNIGELTRISTRIAEQMRRLDNETEAQMLFRREKHGGDDEHFDPLEMDRFTEIQQLSRQLSEAIDDLKNVQGTLANDNTVLRNLASQQGIIQRSLQDRLLTTQLMRFDVNEPRLKRLVRQTAKTLGKEVNFVLEGGQVELERRLLEDVLPALEHMIRNAIAHGIEAPAQRRQAGKPEIGTIKLVIAAQSSEITMRLIDDGQGFDYGRIRSKAREKGILDEAQANDTHYLNSLVLRSGFSTAQSLTQISGRGVGMDVVNEMVKQRRGRLSVDSLPGKGTEFTVVMPFSMSIAEVLLVDIGGRTYAAPMSSITAVSQVSRTDLQESLSGEVVYHRYDERDYRLYVLGSYFEPGNYEFAPEAHQLPVLFIDSGEEAVAFHVDRILNRLEIIVKNVNRQVLNIPGISGATILGDASVVPVLELMDLARRIGSIVPHKEEEILEESTEKRILVVDDSVTMRKVSTRLLERNHFIVETAKDGLDAIEVLQHFKPDLIMLDIEMPRMDGFEFAAHVRQNSDVPNVPIVMVTSRTGDKHRERAGQIGVQGYLGKPYREDILMETLNSLLNTTTGVTS
ncbi:MAG: Hpt domain-containing protein [Cardiobacteriaceae bacterium]|nr:Hpt domain-containing protein [Cardiobacteriaceae bacterium]